MPTLKLTATLSDGEGNPLANKTIEFYRSTDNVNFTLIDTKATDENGVAETTDEVISYGTYYYKARFPGDDTYEEAEATASYTYSYDWSQIMQMFMQWLPWILMIIIVVLLVALLKSASEE